jgi:transcriptional regulator with PAS, ATPase and Fis domain
MGLERSFDSIGNICEHLPKEELIGKSPSFVRIKKAAASVAKRQSTVLILGETGTGKMMLAKYIHELSERANKPFIPVDCLSLTETLFESELFGHVKGAFTGAAGDSIGFARAAEGGTLFLDEIGELSLRLQGKLLRLLQERSVVAVGDVRLHKVNARVIAATNKNLQQMVREGTFREDLFFRLSVITMTMPPLRERIDDIIPLANYFLHVQADLYNEQNKILSAEAADSLCRYDWPGNIRQLANVMEHAHVLTDGTMIELQTLPPIVQQHRGRSIASGEAMTLDEIEKQAITHALEQTHYCKAAAARQLNVNIQRLERLMQRLKISMP